LEGSNYESKTKEALTMGMVHIIAAVLIFAIVMLILLQPIGLLLDELADIVGNPTTKYGTNSLTGEIEEVGPSSAFPDMMLALLVGIGFFITLGFIIWIVRGGHGGVEYEYEER